MSFSTQRSAFPKTTPGTGVIFFALGLLSSPRPGPVESRRLLAVLADLGLSEPAARSVILRLRRQELILSERRGRTAFYSAGPAAVAAQNRFAAYFRDGPAPWNGVFAGLAHDFPEEQRAERDALRRAARLAGYGVLRSGLMISPDDRWPALSERFGDAERAGQILRMQIELTDTDPATIARTAWPLETLAARYTELIDSGRAAVAEGADVEGADALRAMADVALPIYEAIGDDPSLPRELLPPDWPGPALGETLNAAIGRWFSTVSQYLATL